MIVILTKQNDELVSYVTDADAVVRDPNGSVRICRSHKPDEFVDDDVSVCVVPG